MTHLKEWIGLSVIVLTIQLTSELSVNMILQMREKHPNIRILDKDRRQIGNQSIIHQFQEIIS
jgi:hypothetical protein